MCRWAGLSSGQTLPGSHSGTAGQAAKQLAEGAHSWWGLFPAVRAPTGTEEPLSPGGTAQQAALPAGHGAAGRAPWAGTPEAAAWWLPSAGRKRQGVKHSSSAAAVVRGLAPPAQTPLPCSSSLSNARCALLLSRAAWVKPSLCRALCAHLGHRGCLKRVLCGRHCVSVAVFARVWWGAGGRRLTAPTVVLQAPG